MSQHSPNPDNSRLNQERLSGVVPELDDVKLASGFRKKVTAGTVVDIKNMHQDGGHSSDSSQDSSPGKRSRDGSTQDASSRPARKVKTPSIDKFGRDFTEMARNDEFDPVIGRDDEVKDGIAVLLRRTKNNPVYIGEAGVGKTAIVEELAGMISRDEIPGFEGARVVGLDLASMVAGTKYRGQFEERIKGCLQEVKRAREAGQKIVLFVDELHTLMGAGSGSGSMDASNILKEDLARGDVCVIGATTLDEYRKHIEKDAALSRRFQPVMVNPPSRNDSYEILQGLKGRYEDHHKVRYTDEALKAAVEYSADYIPDRHLPDKAIDLVDEAGALLTIRRQRGATDDVVVDETYIASVVSQWTGQPIGSILMNERDRVLSLEDGLNEVVKGQEHVTKGIARGEKRHTAGLSDKKRPRSYMFAGPTGVGKTLTAKTIAELTGRELVQIDMSEYMEKHNVSRLIGAPPGYVGHEEGGQLTEQVRRQPNAVVLLDEIEKAHPAVWRLCLQIMEDGRLTDSHGRAVNFGNVIFVMTTNAGAETASQGHFGFHSPSQEEAEKGENQSNGDVSEKLASAGFPPEFLGRLTGAYQFNKLSKAHIREIIQGEVDTGIGERLREKGIALELSDDAASFLLKNGTDTDYGARPLKRAIGKHLEDRLSEDILKGLISKGDTVKVSCTGDSLQFEYVSEPALDEELEGEPA